MDDGDFDASEEDSTDDEETIQEQEKAEKDIDYKQEIDELNVSISYSVVIITCTYKVK